MQNKYTEIVKAMEYRWTYVLAFIKNFLSYRTFRVRVNGNLSTKQCQENGTPQGSVISPTLFLIAINNITETN